MTNTEQWPGRLALTVAHCAGMLDLIALPVWVGTVISKYGLNPQQAGGLVTLFLVGAVCSSMGVAAQFHRIHGRIGAVLGFSVAAACFAVVSVTQDFATMALLHALAGVAAGCALSFTHGTIGRSLNPHRLFAVAGIGVGFLGVSFFAITPQLVAAYGGSAMFQVFAGIMAVAALSSAMAFPAVPTTGVLAATAKRAAALPPGVWFAIVGVSAMSLVQAMIFSFVERIGSDRGFGFQAVSGVLIALGLVNLTPSPLAALLQKHWSAHRVVLLGPVVQSAIALTITLSGSFLPYAMATAMFAAVMIFTHNFAFGLLAAMDRSGRAVAATPAMLMIGAAIGPLLGGTLVKAYGYGSLGVMATVMAAVAFFCFSRVQQPVPVRTVLA